MFKTLHGESKNSKEYNCWAQIKRRCFSKSSKSFPDYGGRGITVCDRWKNSYSNFLQDVGRAPSPLHTIDRIDNDGNYDPGNVRWATKVEQMNNMSTNRIVEYRGQTKTLSEWCGELNVNYDLVQLRLSKYKWSVEEAFEIPRYGGKRKHWGRTPNLKIANR